MDPCFDNLVEINREDCIGESRIVINNNFETLKDVSCELSEKIDNIEERFKTLVPLFGIINLWSDTNLGGLDFDLSGKGKLNTVTGRDLSAWALCNGNNGTPDLRDRFVVAAGGGYKRGDIGPVFSTSASLGLSSVTLTIPEMPVHTHDVIDPTHIHGVTDPGHEHKYIDKYNNKKTRIVDFILIAFVSAQTNALSPDLKMDIRDTSWDYTNITINPSKTGISINNTGGSKPHENRPPYFALAYIMRYI
jgi:microcystin-dependent protein